MCCIEPECLRPCDDTKRRSDISIYMRDAVCLVDFYYIPNNNHSTAFTFDGLVYLKIATQLFIFVYYVLSHRQQCLVDFWSLQGFYSDVQSFCSLKLRIENILPSMSTLWILLFNTFRNKSIPFYVFSIEIDIMTLPKWNAKTFSMIRLAQLNPLMRKNSPEMDKFYDFCLSIRKGINCKAP